MKQENCPKCGSKELTIESYDIEGKVLWVEVDCMECEWYGSEVYNITFSHHEDKEGNKVEIDT